MEPTLSVEQKAHLGRIAAKQFLLITDKWQLTDDERRVLAGAATRTTISTWRKRVKNLNELQLGNDTYERLICIADIEKSLEEYSKSSMNELPSIIRQPNKGPKNNSLLNNMLNGRVIDLYRTKEHIENHMLHH